MAGLRNVYLSFIIISFGGLLYGYLLGINNSVVTSGQLLCYDDLASEAGSLLSIGYDQCYILGAYAKGLLSCMSLIGASLSSLACFRWADDMGRKRELQIGAACYTMGSLVLASSPVLLGIYVGFMIYGFGIGFCMHAAPLYIAEIAPSKLRGGLVAATEVIIVLGLLAGQLSGAVLLGRDRYGWRFMVLASSILSVFFQASVATLHRSPRWLVFQGVKSAGLLGLETPKVREARESLRYYRRCKGAESEEEIETELRNLYNETRETVVAGAEDTAGRSRCAIAFRNPRLLAIGCGLMFLSQALGRPSTLFLSARLFANAGLAPAAADMGLAGAMLLASTLAACRVEKLGRRRLLLVGGVLMAPAVVVLSAAMLFGRSHIEEICMKDCSLELHGAWAIIATVAMIICAVGHEVSVGPLSWVINAEIFPLNARGSMFSIATFVGFLSNAVVTMYQELALHFITPTGLFLCYVGASVAGLSCAWVFVPETRAKTLEELEVELTAKEEPKDWPASVPRSRCSSSSDAPGSPSRSPSRRARASSLTVDPVAEES